MSFFKKIDNSVRQLGHGRPPDMGKGGENLPSGNVVKCFLCCTCFVKSQSIYALFGEMSASGALPLDPAGVLSALRPPHCLPLEKILRAPVS